MVIFPPIWCTVTVCIGFERIRMRRIHFNTISQQVAIGIGSLGISSVIVFLECSQIIVIIIRIWIIYPISIRIPVGRAVTMVILPTIRKGITIGIGLFGVSSYHQLSTILEPIPIGIVRRIPYPSISNADFSGNVISWHICSRVLVTRFIGEQHSRAVMSANPPEGPSIDSIFHGDARPRIICLSSGAGINIPVQMRFTAPSVRYFESDFHTGRFGSRPYPVTVPRVCGNQMPRLHTMGNLICSSIRKKDLRGCGTKNRVGVPTVPLAMHETSRP